MPPRVRLSADEARRLPALLDQVDGLRPEFPVNADASSQAEWIREQYSEDAPLSLNLVTLLLFEHGVHRSVDQISQDLAILRGDTEQHESE